MSICIIKIAELTFDSLLSSVGGECRTTDARDLVYGFLGLQSEPGIKIIPDYRLPVDIVFAQSTKAIIHGTQSLDVLGVIRRPGILCGEKSNLPTWVPDWSARQIHLPMCWGPPGYPSRFNASAGRPCFQGAVSPESKICIRGRCVAFVSFVSKRHDTLGWTGRLETIKRRLSIDLSIRQIQDSGIHVRDPLTRERVLKVLLADGARRPLRMKYPIDCHPLTVQVIAELLHDYDVLCR